MIIPIHASNPGPITGGGNWTYLITGATPVLIDAGVGLESHVNAIASHVPDGPSDVLVTHGHSDHASGAPAMAARWPRARLWKFLWPSTDAKYNVAWHALSDRQVIPAGADSLHVIYTPGHAPDHVSFWHQPSRTLFSGDLVVKGRTVVIPASSGGSLKEYLESLACVLALGPRRLMPAHGPVIDDPETLIRGYIDHRVERERQILEALGAGLHGINVITERVYAGLDPALVPLARESALAHLQKLEAEGRVRRRGDRWERYTDAT